MTSNFFNEYFKSGEAWLAPVFISLLGIDLLVYHTMPSARFYGYSKQSSILYDNYFHMGTFHKLNHLFRVSY